MKSLMFSISLLLFGSASLFALNPDRIEPNAINFSLIGYKPILVELNFQKWNQPFTFGFEAGLPEGNFTIAPKIGVEWLPFNKHRFIIKDGVYLRLSAAEFFSKASAPDLRVIQQIGYSRRGLALVYAYALPIIQENTMVMRHRISLELSIRTRLFGSTPGGCD